MLILDWWNPVRVRVCESACESGLEIGFPGWRVRVWETVCESGLETGDRDTEVQYTWFVFA